MNELQVPWIRSGVGEAPGDGGCVMQITDWIYRNKWTDEPPCVHPVIRHLAIYINDNLADEERQKLLDLIPRMMNTTSDDEALTRKLLGYLARQAYPVYAAWAETAGYNDGGAVLQCVDSAKPIASRLANVASCTRQSAGRREQAARDTC